MIKVGEVVELDYNDLVVGKDLTADIAKAYGFDGVGVLTVKNVPGFVEARDALLPLSRQFALLPDHVKEKYVHADSYYSFGWSHGKEKLQGKPDVSKGSFYNNPQYDRPVENEEIISNFPSFAHPNIWPTDDLPQLEPAFKSLGQIIVSVGTLVAQQCDKYVKSLCPTYSDKKLETIITNSLCCKARLLHYFPIEASDPSDDGYNFSNWCGWHNDHGSLTGLTSAMFMDNDGNVVENVDTTAGSSTAPSFNACQTDNWLNTGLYARSRKSELIKVLIPKDNIGFQIGETAQVHSGGILQVMDEM